MSAMRHLAAGAQGFPAGSECAAARGGGLVWGPVERVMDGGNGSAAVLAPDGTATAVWVGYSSQVFSREARPGQAWGAPGGARLRQGGPLPDRRRRRPGKRHRGWTTDKNLDTRVER